MDPLIKLSRAVFWLSLMGLTGLALSPAPYLPPLDIFDWWDKAQHAIGYGTLMVGALLTYPRAGKLRLAALLCLHGCLIELIQYLSDYRYGDLQDVAADVVGVFLGMVFLKLFDRLFFWSKQQRQID